MGISEFPAFPVVVEGGENSGLYAELQRGRKAGLDQVAAMPRDGRHKMLRMDATARSDRGTWHLDSHKLAVLLDALLADCADVDECRKVVRWVLDKPFAYRVEYVCAACRARDGRRG